MYISKQSLFCYPKVLLRKQLIGNSTRAQNAGVGLIATSLIVSVLAINFDQPVEQECIDDANKSSKLSYLLASNKSSISFLLQTPRVSYCEQKELIIQPSIQDKTENNSSRLSFSPPSRWRYLLSSLRLYSLPVPRLLTPKDPAFTYPELTRGLRKREQDEKELAKLEKEAIQAKISGDVATIAKVVHKISDIAYGKGITPQMRQDFLIKYGCAAYTSEILNLLYRLGSEHNERGIIEIGAGNGQWARAINDHYKNKQLDIQKKVQFEFIMAFDDMSSLPLSPRIYHSRTKPADEYFYPNVRKSNHIQALQPWESRGRVLLLVFPPPGSMAVETIQEYVRLDEQRNDTVVYVGEGRGGANADEAFFNFFESGDWVLESVTEVGRDFGRLTDKGFEKCFFFKKNTKKTMN